MTDAELSAFAYTIARTMRRFGHVPAAVLIEDIAQAGLVSALEARKRYDGAVGASFRTFVEIRIRGSIRDEIHRQMRSYADTNFEGQEAAHADTPERHALRCEHLERLAQAFDRLPPRWRQLMALRYDDGLTLHECGAVMGFTEARASQLHTQAVERLRTTVR